MAKQEDPIIESRSKRRGRGSRFGRGLAKFTFLSLPPFLLAEVVLRVFFGFGDLPPGQLGLRPDGFPDWPQVRSRVVGVQDGDAQITYNRFGFRGPEWKVERTPGTERAVLVGDSFTFGYGIADSETLAHHLEIARPGLEVINLGIPGLNLHQERMLVEEWVPRLKPDRLILVLYQNDSEVLHCNPPIVPDCLPPTSATERIHAWALEHVYLFRAMNFLLSDDRCRGPQDCPASLQVGTLQHRCFVESLRTIARIAQENEVPLLAVLYPDLGYDWLPGEAARKPATYNREMENLVREEEIALVNLTEPFDAFGGRALKIQSDRDDGHPSGRANQIAAGVLLERLSWPETSTRQQ